MIPANKKKNIQKSVRNLVLILIGSVVYSAGVALFLDPHGIAPGGLTGIAIMINHFLSWDTGLLVLIMNIPLLIIGWVKFGYRFVISTITATVLSSGLITLFSQLLRDSLPVTSDLLLSALAGGLLMGVGMGLIFRVGATTGGTDIIIKLLRQKLRHITSGTISNMIDAVIILIVAIAYRDIEIALYSVLAAGVIAYVLNLVLYGPDNASLVYIVSNREEEITSRLLNEIGVGVTRVYGEGGFTNQKKNVILCVTKKRVFPEVKAIVREVDPDAFMICSSASEIYGEGFKVNSNIEL